MGADVHKYILYISIPYESGWLPQLPPTIVVTPLLTVQVFELPTSGSVKNVINNKNKYFFMTRIRWQ